MIFRNDFKIAFFDVDGTTVITSEGFVRQPAAEALRRLQGTGILMGIATGRPPVHLKLVSETFTPDYRICCNGSIVLDQADKLVYGAPIRPESFEALRRYAREKGAGLAFHFLEQTYIYDNCDQIIWQYDTRVKEGAEVYRVLPSQDRHLQGGEAPYPYNALMMVEDDEDLLRFVESLGDMRSDCPWPHVFDVFRKGQSKAAGIETVLKKEGLTWDDVIVFGDSSNDVEMLSKAGFGVCMGNGCEAAKEAADYVCGTIEEDGLAKAINEIFELG